MPINKDIEPRHGSPGEGDSWPDDPSPEDNQQHPKDHIEVYGSMPVVVKSTVFEPPPLPLTVNGEELKLPQALRQMAHKLTQNKKGEIEATPATPDIRGGGIAPIDATQIDPATKKEIKKTHKRSSHKYLPIPK